MVLLPLKLRAGDHRMGGEKSQRISPCFSPWSLTVSACLQLPLRFQLPMDSKDNNPFRRW